MDVLRGFFEMFNKRNLLMTYLQLVYHDAVVFCSSFFVYA